MVKASAEACAVARIFVSQELVDLWSTDDRVVLDGDVMTLAGSGHQVVLSPAMRVLRVVSDGGDPHNLVGCVKTPAELVAAGGEHYMNSLLLGEAAYDLQAGFIGEPVDPGPAAQAGLHAALLALAQS
jgi:hypothetical protein